MRSAIMIMLLVVAGVAGTLVTVRAFGGLNFSEEDRKPEVKDPTPPKPADEQLRSVIAAPIAMKAYTPMTRDLLLDARGAPLAAKRATPTAIDNLKERLGEEVYTEFGQFKGRVLRRDKLAGDLFVESDFFPVGTRSGVVAGIPVGKRAVVLDASRLRGIHGLNAGDRVDLLATQALGGEFDRLPTAAFSAEGEPIQKVDESPLKDLKFGLGNPNQKALMRVLVNNGVIVRPVYVREEVAEPNRSFEEVLVAVDPAEIPPLMEAMTLQASIQCLIRSGLPHADQDDVRIPEALLIEPEQAARVTRITGGKATTQAVPKGPELIRSPTDPGE